VDQPVAFTAMWWPVTVPGGDEWAGEANAAGLPWQHEAVGGPSAFGLVWVDGQARHGVDNGLAIARDAKAWLDHGHPLVAQRMRYVVDSARDRCGIFPY
jgi:hypothetical protein